MNRYLKREPYIVQALRCSKPPEWNNTEQTSSEHSETVETEIGQVQFFQCNRISHWIWTTKATTRKLKSNLKDNYDYPSERQYSSKEIQQLERSFAYLAFLHGVHFLPNNHVEYDKVDDDDVQIKLSSEAKKDEVFNRIHLRGARPEFLKAEVGRNGNFELRWRLKEMDILAEADLWLKTGKSIYILQVIVSRKLKTLKSIFQQADFFLIEGSFPFCDDDNVPFSFEFLMRKECGLGHTLKLDHSRENADDAHNIMSGHLLDLLNDPLAEASLPQTDFITAKTYDVTSKSECRHIDDDGIRREIGSVVIDSVNKVLQNRKEFYSGWVGRESGHDPLDLPNRKPSESQRVDDSHDISVAETEPDPYFIAWKDTFFERNDSLKLLDRLLLVIGLNGNSWSDAKTFTENVEASHGTRWADHILKMNAIFSFSCAILTLAFILPKKNSQSGLSIEITSLADDYSTEVLWVQISFVFVSIYFITSIIELSQFHQDFHSRLLQAVHILNYDDTAWTGNQKAKYSLEILSRYCCTLMCIFVCSEDIRLFCSVLGYSIFDTFRFQFQSSSGVTTNSYSLQLSLVGFMLLLYVVICVNLIIIDVVVKASILESVAERFKSRLAHRLETSTHRLPQKGHHNSAKYHIVQSISYAKLCAEQQIIVSIARRMVYNNTITAFGSVFYMAMNVFLLLWMLMKHLLAVEPLGKDYTWDWKPISILLVATTSISIWTFHSHLSGAHNAVNNILEYVKRQGFMSAGSAGERKLILSIHHSFIPMKTTELCPSRKVDQRKFCRALFAVAIIGLLSSSVGSLNGDSSTNNSSSVAVFHRP